MLLYELRKIFGARNVLIVIIALLLLNFLLVYFSASDNERIPLDVSSKLEELYFSSREDYQTEYLRVCDEYWQARDNGIEYSSYNYDTSGNISDFSLFLLLNEKIEYYEGYKERISLVLSDAEKRKAEIKWQGLSEDSFSYKYQDEVIDIYSEHTELLDCETVSVLGWAEYLLYDEVNIIIVVCVVLIGIHLINIEKSVGTLNIIRTTRFGRRATKITKICAGVFVAFLLTLLFTLSTLLAFGVRYGFSSPFVPVQLIEEFSLAPWHFNILQTVLLNFAFKCLASVFTVIISMLVANFADHISSYLIIVAFLALNYSVYLVIDSNQIRHINIFSVSSSNIIVRYRAVPLFGECMDIITVILAGYIGLSFVMFTISVVMDGNVKLDLSRYVYAFLNKAKTLLPKASVKYTDMRRSKKCFGVLAFELYKHRGRIALIAIIVLIKIVWSYSDVSAYESSSNELLYKEYLDMLYGEVTQEKIDALYEERQKMSEILQKEQAMRISYELGEISEEEYRSYSKEFFYYSARQGVFQNVVSKAQYLNNLKNNGESTAMFFYDSGFYRLYERNIDILLNLGALILCGSIFVPEYKKTSSSCGMDSIIRLAKHGRNKAYRSKFFVAALGSFIVYSIFFIIDFICISLKYGIDPFDFTIWNASVVNLEKYANINSSISLLQYLMSIFFFGGIGVVLLSIAYFSVSNICEKPFFIYSVVFVFALIPFTVYLGGMEEIAPFSIILLQNPDKFILSPEVKATVMYSLYLLSVFVFVCVSNKKWQGDML